jgi:hypothetical protein
MSGLIDDEIASLEKVGDNASVQQIAQLNTAKNRLKSGTLSSMSLKNSDVVYAGENDSERRRNEYNTTQHETMHQYGAKDEKLVDTAAGALQEAKLVGRVPKSDAISGGKSYEEVLGKMIANMEQAGANQTAMNQAVTAQIAKWQVPNAQRVIETENGDRDTVKDVIEDVKEKPSVDTEKLIQSVDKLTEALDKPVKGSSTTASKESEMSIASKNFFRLMFNGVKTTIKKDDSLIGEKLKPLSAIALGEEVNKIE